MACRACDRSSTTIDVRHVDHHERRLPVALRQRQAVPERQRRCSRSSSADGNWPASAAPAPGCRSTSPCRGRLRPCSTATPPDSGRTWCPACRSTPPTSRINNWFNPAAFSAPANGPGATWAATSPMDRATYEIDSSLQKRFRVTEQCRPQLPRRGLQPVQPSANTRTPAPASAR